MSKYSKYHYGKIYKITSVNTDKVYIGSTCRLLEERFSTFENQEGHEAAYKLCLKGKKNYTTSFEIFKHQECKIEFIEDYKCESNSELLKRETYWINKTKNAVNKIKYECVIKMDKSMTNHHFIADLLQLLIFNINSLPITHSMHS